jgi:hypothetical protein
LWGGRREKVKTKKFKIEFVIRVPENISDSDVETWARFMVGDCGKISQDNPLYEESFDPVLKTFKIGAAQ